jgi:hypothetical protein
MEWEIWMRLQAIPALMVLLSSWGAVAQSSQPSPSPAPIAGGRTAPEDKGQLQPQGWTGPINTQSGGAPAESPQGQSPPGMQAAPDGSNKTVVAPKK